MTRIYTVGLESMQENQGAYLVVMVAHKNSRGARAIAKTEAVKHGGPWTVAHLEERRTGIRIPMGEVLGASGPFTFEIENA